MYKERRPSKDTMRKSFSSPKKLQEAIKKLPIDHRENRIEEEIEMF